MQLHEIGSFNKKRTQRIGRGGKRGTTSGRGTKGQKSRAGSRMRPALRDLIIRLPKHRGFRNKVKSDKPIVIDIAALMKKVVSMGTKKAVDHTFLKSAGLIPVGYQGTVKILGKGEVKQAITVKGITASKSVASQIEKAGGKLE